MAKKKEEIYDNISPQVNQIMLTCGHFVNNKDVINDNLMGQSVICKSCEKTKFTVGVIAKVIKEDQNTATVVLISKIIKPLRRI